MKNVPTMPFCAVMFALIAPQVDAAPLFTDSFSDGDFSASPVWADASTAVPPGSVEVVDEAVRFRRSGAGGSGGRVGIAADVSIPVDESTTVSFDGMPVSRSVGAGCGWGCGEYPVTLEVYLTDAVGAEYRIRYALNYGDAVADLTENNLKQTAVSVPQGEWARGNHFRIREYWPEATTITKLYAFASGWDFEGYIDNIAVSGSTTTVDGCRATYANGLLHVPCVDVAGPFGDTLSYQVDMAVAPMAEELMFQVTGVQTAE